MEEACDGYKRGGGEIKQSPRANEAVLGAKGRFSRWVLQAYTGRETPFEYAMDEEERIQEGTEFRRTQVSLVPGTVMINPKLYLRFLVAYHHPRSPR